MDAVTQEDLAQIGRALDRHQFTRVLNGGLVVLDEHVVPLTASTERFYERENERGSAVGARQRSAGWQRPSGGSWPPSATAQVVCADPEEQYKAELDGLAEHYPGAQFWHQNEGVWLLTKSRLLSGLRQYAIFLTGIFFPGRMVRSWAFWADPVAFPLWIGPRHTNFPDGSVCAFEPMDRTWIFGEPLVKLLDLYAVWALRHLHLQAFGRWPGQQAIHFPGERILELSADEHCGCANSERLYGECCMPKDMAGDRIAACLAFFWRTGGFRVPPQPVVDFVRHGKTVPSVADLFNKAPS
jgi:hypothetical protein